MALDCYKFKLHIYTTSILHISEEANKKITHYNDKYDMIE